MRLIFDEDIKTMVYPKIKQYLFRTSADSPLEVGAKALAYRNGHPEKWSSYSFSYLKKEKEAGI